MIVMSAKIPKALDTAAMQAEMLKALKSSAKQLLAAHEQVVSTWNPPAKFILHTETSRLQWTLWVYTLDDRYRWTDKGTKPHQIRAKTPSGLIFKTGYKAKSKVGGLSPVVGGGRSSGPWIRKQVVNHPGTKARDFTGQIKKRYDPLFRKEMAAAMFRAAKASGQGR